MLVNILAFGIAKDIIGSQKLEIELSANCTVERLKGILCERYPKFSDLRSLSFAVDEEYREDGYVLQDGVEIVLIPPVSGG